MLDDYDLLLICTLTVFLSYRGEETMSVLHERKRNSELAS